MEQCRLWGHAWFPYDAEAAPGGWREVLYCERCSTKRTFLLDRNGTVHSRAYDYAEGYRDAERIAKADRRAAYYASTLSAELDSRKARKKAI